MAAKETFFLAVRVDRRKGRGSSGEMCGMAWRISARTAPLLGLQRRRRDRASRGRGEGLAEISRQTE